MRKTQKLKRFLSVALALSLCIGLLATSGLTLTAKAANTTLTLTTGSSASKAEVKYGTQTLDDNAMKIGTSSKGGSFSIKVPAGSTGLSFYAVSWKGTSNVTAILSWGTSSSEEINLTADAGATSNSPFTMTNDPDGETGYKHTVTFDQALTEETTITVSTEKVGKRAVFFCIEAISGSGDTDPSEDTGETTHTHIWDEGKVTKEPTCTEEGEKTFTCTDTTCGETKIEKIPANGHTDANNDKVCDIETCKADLAIPVFKKVTSAPSNDDWSGTYLIVYEDEKFIFDGSLTTLDASNNYQTVTITEDNTITISEEYAFYIVKDGDGYTIKSASGKYIHNTSNANSLKASDTAPDSQYKPSIGIDDQGEQGDVKIVSSESVLRFNTTSGQDRFRFYKSGSYASQQAIQLYKKVESTPAEPDLSDKTVINAVTATLDGKIGLNYYFSLPQSVDANTAKVHFNGSEIATVGNLPKDKNGFYIFTYRLNAKEMYDQVTFAVYDENNTPIDLYYPSGESVKEYKCSVAEYLQTLSSGTDEALTKLANATLDYGAYAKTHFKYKLDTPATVDPADVSKVTIDEKYKMEMPATMPANITYKGMTLTLEEGTTIRLYFEAAAESEYTLDGTKYKTIAKDGLYYVEVENIAAKDLGKMYTLVIDGCTYKFSALSYAYTAVHENGTDVGSLLNVVKALNQYYLAADAYFPKEA